MFKHPSIGNPAVEPALINNFYIDNFRILKNASIKILPVSSTKIHCLATKEPDTLLYSHESSILNILKWGMDI